MNEHEQTGWEPDLKKMGNWRSMFEQPCHGGAPSGGPPSIAAPTEMPDEYLSEDAKLAPNMSVYRPWILQRTRSRPAMMIDLRRFEPRSGMWTGWALCYPSLLAAEYVGDRMLSLDFGSRQFVIEGHGLDELLRDIQQGTVIAIEEYIEKMWPTAPRDRIVSAIRKIE